MLHNLTSQTNFSLRIDLLDFKGNRAHAKYTAFQIGSPDASYRLLLGEYTGNATDAFNPSPNGAKLNGMKFTTLDIDNDRSPKNCASQYGGQGGWWYDYCFFTNLNGIYRFSETIEGWDGIVWYTWRMKRPLKWTEMKIRPATFAVG